MLLRSSRTPAQASLDRPAEADDGGPRRARWMRRGLLLASQHGGLALESPPSWAGRRTGSRSGAPLAEVAGDPFAVGPWCWVLRKPRSIRPVPWKGQVSFFEVPDRLVRVMDGNTRIVPGTSGPA